MSITDIFDIKMDGYTVKQLKELLRNAKKNSKTCISYSKLKKPELYNAVVDLGLVSFSEENSGMESPAGLKTPRDRIEKLLEYMKAQPDSSYKTKAIAKIGGLFNRLLLNDSLTKSQMLKLQKYESVLP